MIACRTRALRFIIAMLVGAPAPWVLSGQNPSPMVEHTRAHPRLPQVEIAGRRHELVIGLLTIPAGLEPADAEAPLPLLIHFHGGDWIPEVAAESIGAACISVQLGSGSGTYAKPFRERESFLDWLTAAEKVAGRPFSEVTLTGWSAGCGAIREILKFRENDDRIGRVILLDGVHTSYVNGTPGPRESEIDPAPLASLVRFARLAMAGKKEMVITHTEIFPGTFASTTETADWLLRNLGVPRRAVLRWGPMQTQQLSEAGEGKFAVAGFAGNSAPDHIDQLHALPEMLRREGSSPTE